MSSDQEVRELVCELCRLFYEHGWVTGTGGSISIRWNDGIYMTPSGVQKERIHPDDLFVVDKDGKVITPPTPKPGRSNKLSDCAPLFLHAYNQRDAGAVLHSHGVSCNLITLLFEDKPEFRITKQEMIKGIEGHGYYDELVIPIIENTAWEHELADSLGEAIAKYPKAPAVLVRHHGMYVWGKTWEQAKRHAECLHYLFDSLIGTYQLGLSHLVTKNGSNNKRHLEVIENGHSRKLVKRSDLRYTHIVLDIEGTISPISFVKETLFPYASQHAGEYLKTHWSKPEIQTLAKELASDYKTRHNDNTKDITDNIEEFEKYIQQLIKDDIKLTPLKTLQGLIWEDGYVNKSTLLSNLFDDIHRNLKRFHDDGINVSIYSSGSRKAQQLLLRYSNYGDLTSFVSSYFDTKVGHKQEKTSYSEIALTLGAEKNEKILFITDVLGEAKAAKEAGLSAIISLRAGNAVISEEHEFETITNFDSIIIHNN